jgi:hypothetical protein
MTRLLSGDHTGKPSSHKNAQLAIEYIRGILAEARKQHSRA